MFYSQGDIILLPFPFSDQSDGKPRPAIILSNSLVNSTKDIICAALTTTIRNDQFSYPINAKTLTKPLKNNVEGEVRCHKIFQAEKTLIKAKVSSLKAGKYEELLKKITPLIAIEPPKPASATSK